MRADGRAGQAQTALAAHFAKRNTKKYGGAEKRAGKNFYPVLAKQICGAFP